MPAPVLTFGEGIQLVKLLEPISGTICLSIPPRLTQVIDPAVH